MTDKPKAKGENIMRKIVEDYLKKPSPELFKQLTSEEQRFVKRQEKAKSKEKK